MSPEEISHSDVTCYPLMTVCWPCCHNAIVDHFIIGNWLQLDFDTFKLSNCAQFLTRFCASRVNALLNVPSELHSSCFTMMHRYVGIFHYIFHYIGAVGAIESTLQPHTHTHRETRIRARKWLCTHRLRQTEEHVVLQSSATSEWCKSVGFVCTPNSLMTGCWIDYTLIDCLHLADYVRMGEPFQ